MPEYVAVAQQENIPPFCAPGHNRHHFILFYLRFILISRPVQEIYNAFTVSNKTLLFVLRFICKDYIDVIEIYICSGDCDLSVVEELLTARLQSVQSAVCEETNLVFSLSLSTGLPKKVSDKNQNE